MKKENKSSNTHHPELGKLVYLSPDRSVRGYEGYGRFASTIKIPDNTAHLEVRQYSNHDFGDAGELNTIFIVRGGHQHHEPLLSFNPVQEDTYFYQGFTPDGDSWRFSAETPDQMIGFLASLFNPGQLDNREIEIEFAPGPNHNQVKTSDFYEYIAQHTGTSILSELSQEAAIVA